MLTVVTGKSAVPMVILTFVLNAAATLTVLKPIHAASNTRNVLSRPRNALSTMLRLAASRWRTMYSAETRVHQLSKFAFLTQKVTLSVARSTDATILEDAAVLPIVTMAYDARLMAAAVPALHAYQ